MIQFNEQVKNIISLVTSTFIAIAITYISTNKLFIFFFIALLILIQIWLLCTPSIELISYKKEKDFDEEMRELERNRQLRIEEMKMMRSLNREGNLLQREIKKGETEELLNYNDFINNMHNRRKGW